MKYRRKRIIIPFIMIILAFFSPLADAEDDVIIPTIFNNMHK